MMLANTTTNNSNNNPVATTSKSSISSLLSSSSPSASPPPSPATMKTTTNLLTLPASFTANSLSTALAATTTTGSNTNPSFSDDPTTALLMLKESLQKHSPAFSKLPTSKSDSVLSSTEVIDLSSRSSYHTPSKTSGVGTNSTSASPSPRSSPSPAVFTTTVSSTSRSISPSNTMTLNVPKRLLFESAGTYGLQRNVPFLLRNSTIWRPGALPTPTNINPATGTIFSQFEYVRMNFPTSMCSVEEVTKRNRNTRAPHPATARATMGSPSSPAMMRPGAHASVIDLKVECKVFVVKDGIREKDPANEVKDVFVVREHPQKMVRRGEELQISVRFHKLPSDFISSSREFVFSIRMYRINVNNSSPLSPNKLHQQDEEFLFESDIILHSKSRTKPGQSAKEAAAEREANRIMAQQQVAAATAAGSGSPMTSSMHNLSISSPKVGSSNWRSTSLSPDSSSPSPNASPSRIVIPSATKLSSSSVPLPSSPTFDAASLVYNLQRSSSGSPSTRYSSASHASNSSAPLLGDLCEEADRVSKRARISSLLNTSSDSLTTNSIASDTRTAEEVEESRKHWVKFLQQVGIEQPEKAASILVKEKIEISQLASLRFEVLRALGFLVGDILRMIDHSATYLKENPTLANASVNQISNQISSIHLNRSNSSINTLINSSSGLPNSISPSPCASPRTSYETNEGSTKHRQVSRNAKDEIEDGVDEDSGDLQIDDDDNGKEDSMTPAAKVSNEDRKDKESLTSEYSGDEAEEVENEKKRRRPSAFHLHPSREQMEIFDVQEALIKLSNSPPPNRFQPIRTQAAIVKSSLGRSALTSSSSALPTVNSTPNATTTSSSSSSSTIAASLPSSKVSTQLRETIKLVQRFADKMVSKISNVNNLDQELAERSREMANVVSHLEACLALSSPPAKPYTLEEIEAVSQRISNNNNQKGLNCSSDSVDSPRLSSVALRSSANQIHNNNSSCSDNESTDGDYDLDEGDSDTENLDAFQPLAYYVGVIKAHLELRKPDASRKSSGLKRDVLKKEYVLVPIEEASRVLGISTTKLSRAYKSTSILSRCGWVFKGRKRRLRWPTRPLRVLLKYICEKYLCEMANSYVSLEADKQQQQQRLPRSHSLDHLLI